MSNVAEHLKMIKFLQEKYAGKKFYVECYPTDNGAIKLPNSNWAVKYIELPTFESPSPTGDRDCEELKKEVERLKKENDWMKSMLAKTI
jgi:hypothetical protein